VAINKKEKKKKKQWIVRFRSLTISYRILINVVLSIVESYAIATVDFFAITSSLLVRHLLEAPR